MGKTYTGDQIRKYRKEKGFTQKELGERCGMDEANIRKYELGNANPKLETLHRIANALNISYLKLVESEIVESSMKNVEEERKNILKEFVRLNNELKENNTPELKKQIVNVEEQLNTNDKQILELLYEMDNIETDKDKINKFFDTLNKNGRKKAVDYIKDLTKIPEYRKV